MAAAIIAIAMAVGFGFLLTLEPSPVVQPQPLWSVRPDGDEMIVSWHGTSCDKVRADRATVEEDAEQVEVLLYVELPVDGCPDPERVTHSQRLPLDDPLGDRTVVDGACTTPRFATSTTCLSTDVPVSDA